MSNSLNQIQACQRNLNGTSWDPKRILFVEGNANSLDLPLYNALFPGLSVIPKGSCIDVEKAVKGMRGSQSLHHVEAFGLIDRDNRDEEKVSQLAEGGVFALDVYSVESLYFCSDAIAAVAYRKLESLGRKAGDMIKSVEQNALDALEQDDLAVENGSTAVRRQST